MNSQPLLVIHPNGTRQWTLNGKYHREDGPAIEYLSGTKVWYLNGMKHREGGPAIEYSSRKEWYFNDRRHREDGPAIELFDGTKYWFLNDEGFSFEDYIQELRKLRGEEAVINLLFNLDKV
jgi:hypothetical protein